MEINCKHFIVYMWKNTKKKNNKKKQKCEKWFWTSDIISLVLELFEIDVLNASTFCELFPLRQLMHSLEK